MAPRATKGAKAKSTEGSKGKRVEDTLLMDARKKNQPQLEETIEDVNNKNDRLKQALLGYARFDVLEHRDQILFGKWNPRTIQKAEIAGLVESFQVNGLDRFNPTHAMPLIVPKSIVKPGTFITEVKAINEIPLLQINMEVGKNWTITAAGGQHRVYALEVWLDRKKKQLDEYLAVEKSLKSQEADKVDEAELAKWNKSTKKEKDILEGIIAYGGQWLVSLFDDDKIDETLALHISKNETKHVYMETPMEGLVQKLKLMKAEGRTYQNVKLLPQSKGTAAKQMELLKQDYVWEMLTYFDTAGVHYWHADYMKFTEFYNTMFSSYGGVLAYLVRTLERRMQMCFNTVEVDEARVEKLLSMLRTKNAERAQEALEEIYEKLRDATPVTDAIGSAMRDAMDNAFETCIQNTTGIQEIGNPSSSDWSTVFAQYGSEVSKKMQEQVDAMAERGDLSRVREHITTTLKTSPLKARILFACETNQEDFSSFPFMSRSLFKILKEHLSRIEMAILELSSWWSPYVYATKVHPKEWMPGSASADMRRAIWAHPDFHADSRRCVWEKIVLIIFESYPALPNMEGQLSAFNVPNHSLSQSELLGIFGMSLSGGSKPAKPSTSKKGKAKKIEEEEYGDLEYVDGQDDDENDSGEEREDMSADDDEDRDVRKGESRQERLDRREKEKVQAEARVKSLEMEAAQATKILINSRKVSSPALAYCDKAWTRKSKITSEAGANAFCGQDLIKWHTWEWAALLGPSRTRILRILGCLTIFEACAIRHYRPSLLSDPTGGAATIRFKIETDTAIFRITRVATNLIQTTLDQPKQRPSKVAVTLTWPDCITCAKPTVDSFDLHTELSRQNQAILRLAQQTQIQRVITCVESQRVAWEDTTNTALARDRPPLEEAVQHALEGLVLALNANAYRQRSDYLGLDEFKDDFSMDIDGLDVVYRGGLEGPPKVPTQRKKFIVLARTECEGHMEDTIMNVSGKDPGYGGQPSAPLVEPTESTKAAPILTPISPTSNRFTPLADSAQSISISPRILHNTEEHHSHDITMHGEDDSMELIEKENHGEKSPSDDRTSDGHASSDDHPISVHSTISPPSTHNILVYDTPPIDDDDDNIFDRNLSDTVSALQIDANPLPPAGTSSVRSNPNPIRAVITPANHPQSKKRPASNSMSSGEDEPAKTSATTSTGPHNASRSSRSPRTFRAKKMFCPDKGPSQRQPLENVNEVGEDDISEQLA
ncbi:hypothetical protein EDD15DRAFT_2371889 [Pisolithus albus]|nr:hypothetical protein EDD15DRAFT_2371889 [Pisolithus albus]